MGKAFYCKTCHALEDRIRLLTKGCLISPMWRDLDADAKAALRAEYANLKKAALKDQLTIKITQHIRAVESSWTEAKGQYYPISVYETQGYDKSFLKYIEASCPMRWQGSNPGTWRGLPGEGG